ncbi:hypothetical protein [Streptomyces sp. 184]|uniref:hypothetical protein n=1 Tax=Streptomyces sp. 184 TaxID=1827526 RepID=UPI003891B9AC
MIPPRTIILALAAATLTSAGCADSAEDDPASSPRASSGSPSASTPASPAAKPGADPDSAFCLDLEVYQVGLVTFRADVLRAAQGEPTDIEDLKARAANVEMLGDEMKSTAPPDIAEDFHAVRKAVRTSANRLKPGASGTALVGPLLGDDVNPSFDAMNAYECAPEAD